MTPKNFPVSTNIGVGRLEFWTQKLVQIAGEQQKCLFDLADLGVILKTTLPTVSGVDSPKVIRLKERLLVLQSEKDNIFKEFKQVGARLFDRDTLEIVIQGGPQPGAWLSWQPGERCIAWWRSSAESGSERQLLPGFDLEDVQPIIH